MAQRDENQARGETKAERKQARAGGSSKKAERKQARAGGQTKAERKQGKAGRGRSAPEPGPEAGAVAEGAGADAAATEEIESRLARIEEAVAAQSKRSQELLEKVDDMLRAYGSEGAGAEGAGAPSGTEANAD